EDYVVWGAVWKLNECNICTLDNQEGVADKLYFSLMVDIETPTGEILKCRMYQQCNNPNEHIKSCLLPKHRRPLPLYLETILNGAYESNQLPCDYIKVLEKIPHNEYTGEYNI
ncbi:unnamed protein product, partial [Heterotrigona itama]